MEDELDLLLRIETYAHALVLLHGFKGDEAERERELVVTALVNGNPIDYVRLGRRGTRHVRVSDLRARLKQDGLSDSEIDALLEEFPPPSDD